MFSLNYLCNLNFYRTQASAPVSTQQRTNSTLSVNSSASSGPKKSSVVSTAPLIKKSPALQATPSPIAKNGNSLAPAPIIQGIDPKLFEQLKIELEEVRQQLTESDDVVVGLEKERDFYFAKLRKIEVMCQEDEQAGTVTDAHKLLEVSCF